MLKCNLEKFSSLLANHLGMQIDIAKEADLQRKLEKLKTSFGFDDVSDFLKFLTETDISKKHIVTLAKDLTVGETYFFRHHPTYKTLLEKILPEIIQEKEGKQKEIKVWSAGCCTGEEPYSVAILLSQLVPNTEEWQINILGTDINEDFLKKAHSATYKEWSFRDTPQNIKERYFSKEDSHYILDPQIREMVTFEYLNLIEHSHPSEIAGTNHVDLILCNNVLIYFTPEKINHVLNNLTHSLSENGRLIVSTIEAPFVENPLLTPERTEELFFFKKQAKMKPEPHTFTSLTTTTTLADEIFEVEKTELNTELLSRCLIDEPSPSENKEESLEEEKWEIAYNEKNYELCIQLLEESLTPYADDKKALSKRNYQIAFIVKSFANIGNIPMARQWCEKGLIANKVDPLLYYLYGMLLQEVESYDEAVSAFQSALFLDPTVIMAHFSLGAIALKQNQQKAAKRHFRNALDLLKQRPEEEIILGTDDLTAERLQTITENIIKNQGLIDG